MGVPETPQFKFLEEFNPSKYWKEQEFQSSTRLHMQNWLWLYTLGYTIDPKIELPKDEPFRVADVGCCNGAWMLDLHREYPNAVIDGFDLTDAHFPAAGWMPPNVNFHVWDAFTAVPDEYVGVFDVMHIRGLYSGVINNKVEPLVENVLKMLKPGGYIQWEEGDSAKFKVDVPPGVYKSTGQASTTLATFFHTSETATSSMKPDWVHALPTTLKTYGCEVLTQDWLPMKKELHRVCCDNYLTSWRTAIMTLPEEPFSIPPTPGLPDKMSRATFFELLKKSAEECRNGVFLSIDFCTFAARKAM